jgi:hypothetical protein
LVDDEVFRGSIRTLVTQLLEFLLKHLWTVVMPGGALLNAREGGSAPRSLAGLSSS